MAKETHSKFEPISPDLGIVPKSRFGRLMLAFAVLNTILSLLPLFTPIGNGREMVLGLLPGTIFYVYAVYTLNCILALVYYAFRSRKWASSWIRNH